jgi:hypothetical protein
VTIRLIPPGLIDEFRTEAAQRETRPNGRVGAIVIVLIWFAAIAVTGWWLQKRGVWSFPGSHL